MAKRKVVWTINSEFQLKDILEFYTIRNKSSNYSKKLYEKFKSELKTAASNPDIGVKTKLENIRGLIIHDYILFYEVLDDRIMVLKVWDCRQDPNKLDIER